ncbi:hypothetical protein H0B47_21360 [Pseudomonas aeruginosa]|uniref:hypothetical protein n=1 Tax=Pseudomonas aeruginosa TaxID=287 RepID=UPI0015D5051D|nr:hypothetical protein [Pseudomonas aeruginosa]MDP5451058.1 hypothetical protein [Pseudomonas aeruginosa]NYU36276.1 hypothetical protein [Pseudomonas aeruginosa]
MLFKARLCVGRHGKGLLLHGPVIYPDAQSSRDFFSIALGQAPLADGLLVALWGMAFGTVPVTWSTWITVTVPDEAESGGGLLVATIQLSIAVGAAAGGAVFDASGARGVCLAATMYCWWPR